MKTETKEKIFEILEPVVEFLEENGVDAAPAIFRISYGAIRVKNYSHDMDTELYKFIKDKDCNIFSFEKWLDNDYIIFSFTIDGKESHAWD